MQEDIRGFVDGLSRGVLVEKELFIMVFGILFAGCVLPSVNSSAISHTAIFPPSSSEPAMLPPKESPRNLSNYDVLTPPCTSETIQVAFDAYACNTSVPIVYFNKSNTSDTFNAWGMAVAYSEVMINDSKITRRDFYKVIIEENISDPRWSKDTIYSRILAHELCHVQQYRENRALDESECNRKAGWVIWA